MEIGSLFGLVVLILDIWAILNIVQSPTTTGKKALWIVLILILPVVGLIIWALFGPKKAGTAAV